MIGYYIFRFLQPRVSFSLYQNDNFNLLFLVSHLVRSLCYASTGLVAIGLVILI